VSAPDPVLLAKLSADRALASVILFKHRHPQAEASMHIEMMDLFFSADELVQLEAFRGAAKTTKLEEALILAGCFGTYRYMLLIGEIYDKACQRLASIDRELRMNIELHRVFGGDVLAKRSNENKVWFASGSVLQAVGWEQELQSFKEGVVRPDLAAMDDVENKESVRDRKAVDQSEEKFYDELKPAMDQTRYKIINDQTRLAEDCMVTRFAKDPEFVYRGYPICNGDPDDPNTLATWPERYPMEWIRKERRLYKRRIAAFNRVYLLQASAPESKPFRNAKLPSIDASQWQWQPRVAIYDPARTSRERRVRSTDLRESARTGKVVLSRMGSRIVVHESSGNYWKPSELLADFFACNERHHPYKMLVEKNSLDDWLLEPARVQMIRRAVILPLVAMNAPQDQSKDEFITALVGFFEAGEIVLSGGASAHPDLMAELDAYPQGLRDVLNAMAYGLKAFSGAVMYEDFNGTNISEAPQPRRGETLYAAFNASPSEVVAVGVLREARRFHVAFDCARSGALMDTTRDILFELRARFPESALQIWVPAEVFDQWQRIPLVPALRQAKASVLRAEHIGPARGKLADRIRNEWHQKKLLLVDRQANLTLNALAAGYALPVEKGGRTGSDPEPGTSRLVAEALECMVAKLDQAEQASVFPVGAHLAHAKAGTYISVNPHPR
jgi:hypothetical protein